jgi:glycosyltransferase involved in cell wall biosynthesis
VFWALGDVIQFAILTNYNDASHYLHRRTSRFRTPVTIRVLQIIPTLVRGGAEKQMALLARGLPPDEFDVHVAVLTHTGPLEASLQEANIPVTQIGKRWKIDPFAYARLKSEIRRLQPDIVHTWLFAANSYGRRAAFSAGVKHIIAGERCVDPWKGRMNLWIDRALAKRTERIVTNSSGVKDFYVERGIAADKFTIIPNGIAPAAPAETTSREQLLAELGLSAAARLVGTVGRLWPQKRVSELIWATKLIQDIRAEVHLLIIGDGPQRWRLERFREQVATGDRVHFLGERSDVARILPHLECFWLASGYEGQSNAIMEAMAAGLPVIATDIPGNRDLVVPEETGYLVRVTDAPAFSRWTNVLLDDPDLRQRLGRAGRERMLREFTLEQMIARHAQLYRDLAG